MMLTISACLEVLERRRDLIAAAISSLRALEAADNPALALAREELQKPTTPPTPRAKATQASTPAPAPKAARAASQAAPLTPTSATTKRTSSGANRIADVVLAHLRAQAHPQNSSDVAVAIGRSYAGVNYALVALEKASQVVRSGNGNKTRWAVSAPKSVVAQAEKSDAPRNGARPVRAEGVEFDTVFDGSRGQSLLGDRDSKGGRLNV